MYAQINLTTIFQGDILKNYPFISLPSGEEPLLLRRSPDIDVKPLSQTTSPYSLGEEKVVVNSFLRDGIIITQTCDIGHRQYVHICPVFTFKEAENDPEYVNDQAKLSNFLGAIRNDKYNYFWYLPKPTDVSLPMEECYVDFQMVNIIPKANLDFYERKISLSDLGRHRLAYKLNTFYGRPF